MGGEWEVGVARMLGGGGGGKTFKNKTARHTMKLFPQNSFGEMHSQKLVRRQAQSTINALRTLAVYPVFEDEKSNGSDKKSVKLRSNNRLATNFV